LRGNLCRHALTLRNDREPVVLGHDALYVADHVITDDDELDRVAADLVVLLRRDRNDAVADIAATLADHPDVAARLGRVSLFEALVYLSRCGLIARETFFSTGHKRIMARQR